MRVTDLAKILAASLLLACSVTGQGLATCKARMINPVTEVAWSAIFPIRIGGVALYDTDKRDTGGDKKAPVCLCSNIPGLLVSFWDPFQVIEVVHDPWCFPSLGISLDGVTIPGHLEGTVTAGTAKARDAFYFAQAHYIKFPVWSILHLLRDIPCVDSGGLDPAYFTELDPLWQDDLDSLILNPEGLVFANPVLQSACMADAVATASGLPRDELYWCMGQWGSVYPMAGGVNTSNQVVGAAAVAGRMLYKLNRQMLVCDRAIRACGCVHTPIWVKSHYRLQVIRPRLNTGSTLRIGEPSPIWETGQTSPMERGSENWAYIVFRKVKCCVFYHHVP